MIYLTKTINMLKSFSKTALLIIIISLNCCTNSLENNRLNYYGSEISTENIYDYENIKAITLKDGLSKTKLQGKIIKTCPKKGCWMSLDTGTDTLFVRFRDYGFFVPTDSVSGKKAIVEGDLFIDTISIEMLKHYAEDEGKSEEEIALIKSPSYNLNFTADGVIIED